MQNRLKGAVLTVAAAATVAFVLPNTRSDAAPPPEYKAERTPDGNPNLNGIWQALGSAHWDIEGHSARHGAIVKLGALGAIPGGMGVVEGGEIPYKPEALAKKKENQENWVELDPAIKCFMPGIPRATYMPFPFQIIQGTQKITMAYEYSYATRVIHMDEVDPSPIDTWMGHSVGRWEEDTLVVDVTSQLDRTWFDRAGNFHSEALHVVERYTPISPYHLRYEAQIEDPNVFTRPWTISLPLYRRIDDDVEIGEFRCAEFTEPFIYGTLSDPPLK